MVHDHPTMLFLAISTDAMLCLLDAYLQIRRTTNMSSSRCPMCLKSEWLVRASPSHEEEVEVFLPVLVIMRSDPEGAAWRILFQFCMSAPLTKVAISSPLAASTLSVFPTAIA